MYRHIRNYTGFSTGNATASGNTITGTVNLVGVRDKSDFYGYAYEYTTFRDTSGEWWGDWAPKRLSMVWDGYG